jgi:hypothetical protein
MNRIRSNPARPDFLPPTIGTAGPTGSVWNAQSRYFSPSSGSGPTPALVLTPPGGLGRYARHGTE